MLPHGTGDFTGGKEASIALTTSPATSGRGKGVPGQVGPRGGGVGQRLSVREPREARADRGDARRQVKPGCAGPDEAARHQPSIDHPGTRPGGVRPVPKAGEWCGSNRVGLRATKGLNRRRCSFRHRALPHPAGSADRLRDARVIAARLDGQILPRQPEHSATAEECHAWEEFFFTYDDVVRVTVAQIHHAFDIIDDIAQEVWITLIRKLPRWKFDPALGTILAWVAKIAKRLAAKRARRNAKRRAASLDATQTDSLVDPEPGPDIEFELMHEHELFEALVLEFAASLIRATAA